MTQAAPFVLYSLYIISLSIIYPSYIAGAYQGYPESTLPVFRLIEAVSVSITVGLTLPRQWRLPSRFFYTVLILSVLAPMAVIYQYSDFRRDYFYTVACTVIAIRLIIAAPTPTLPQIQHTEKLAIPLIITMTAIVYGWVTHVGAPFFFDTFNDLYAVRIQLRSVVTGVWGYFLPWVATVIIPGIIGYGLFKDRKIISLTAILAGVLLFPLTSHKSYAAMALVPLGIYFIFKNKNKLSLVIKCAIIFFCLSVLTYEIAGDKKLLALGAQRSIFKPALLNFVYADVFSERPLVMLANSSVNPFLNYRNDVNPAFIVGHALKGSEETRSNTGFLGTGYMHFGLIGVAVFGLIVGLWMKILDSVSQGWPTWLACVLAFGPYTALVRSGDLFPSLVTNGVIFVCLLLWSVKVPNRYNKKYNYDRKAMKTAPNGDNPPPD